MWNLKIFTSQKIPKRLLNGSETVPFQKKHSTSRRKNGRLQSSETVNHFGLLKHPPGFVPKRYRFGTLTGLSHWEEFRNGTVLELLNGSEMG